MIGLHRNLSDETCKTADCLSINYISIPVFHRFSYRSLSSVMLPFKRLKEKCRIFFGGDIIPLRELQLPYITRCNKNLDKTSSESLGCLKQSTLWLPYLSFYLMVTFFLHPLNYPKVHDYRLRSITGIGLDHKQLTLV